MKRILLFIVCILLYFFQSFSVFAANIGDVFSDISTDYTYAHELQSLYDKGMFSPDENGNFNPDAYLTREEFIGVISEVSCKKCIKPDVGVEYFQKYKNYENFFDVVSSNKYEYCIAGAKDEKTISGYDPGTICENGTGAEEKVPFCPENTIILEEALAILLRTSGILTNEQAQSIREKIRLGEEYPILADDVKPTNNGYVYSFYPDFQKALDFKITEYDADGTEHTYFLLEKEGKFLYPEKALTKEAFLKMAYVAMKGNSCVNSKNNTIGININIFNKECSLSNLETCNRSSLKGEEKIYDFFAEVSKNIDPATLDYDWRIYNFGNGKEVLKTGKYIDNYNFQTNGKYRVYLIVTDENGNSSEVYNDITVGSAESEDNLKVSVRATPLEGIGSLRVGFSGIVSSFTGIRSYDWNFGDGTTATGLKTSHIFQDPGSYTVIFSVQDKQGKVKQATTVITVKDENTDTDGDGVSDVQDYEVYTPVSKILFICTKKDIEASLYGCQKTDLGVYNPNKESALSQKDTDGDGVKDYTDYEIHTDPDKIDTICTKADIALSRFGCKETDLGVATDTNNDPNAADIGLKIHVYDESCTENTLNCKKAIFKDGVDTFDFGTETTLEADENSDSIWTITNTQTGESETVDADYIDNYVFGIPGEYDISVTVTTDTGDSATATTHISVTDTSTGDYTNLSITIDADPLMTSPDSPIDFTAITSSQNDANIVWDFGDGSTDDGKSTTHTYTYEGTYTVTAEITDKDGNTQTASIVVYISNDIDDSDGDGVNDVDDHQINTPISQVPYICTQADIDTVRYGCSADDLGVYNPEKDPAADSDGDGIPDRYDQCPNIPGEKKNQGCPIFEQTCETNTDCPEGYYCDGSYCKLQIIQKSCEYRGKGLFFGNTVCDSCPCEYGFDFRATVRACDIVFPAITSLDEKNIFSKGSYYQIESLKLGK